MVYLELLGIICGCIILLSINLLRNNKHINIDIDIVRESLDNQIIVRHVQIKIQCYFTTEHKKLILPYVEI